MPYSVFACAEKTEKRQHNLLNYVCGFLCVRSGSSVYVWTVLLAFMEKFVDCGVRANR